MLSVNFHTERRGAGLNRAYRVVTHNTPSPIDIAQMAQIRRDAICQSKPMAKYFQKTCLDTLPCELTMHPVCTCV